MAPSPLASSLPLGLYSFNHVKRLETVMSFSLVFFIRCLSKSFLFYLAFDAALILR